MEIEQSRVERKQHWARKCELLAPVGHGVGGQDQRILNLLDKLVRDLLRVERFRSDPEAASSLDAAAVARGRGRVQMVTVRVGADDVELSEQLQNLEKVQKKYYLYLHCSEAGYCRHCSFSRYNQKGFISPLYCLSSCKRSPREE